MYGHDISNEEKDIAVSVIALTAAFAIANRFRSPYGPFFILAVSFLVAITAFMMHELSHRYVGFFNLIPIPPLDGYKVFTWDLYVYIVSIAIALVFVVLFVF